MGKMRDAMQRDMELKNFSPKTMRCYLYWVSRYVLHYRRPPDELGDEEIKAFLHFLRKEKKTSQSSMNQAYSALKFFYETTLGRSWNGAQIPRCKRGKRLPLILSREEVQSILSATENLNSGFGWVGRRIGKMGAKPVGYRGEGKVACAYAVDVADWKSRTTLGTGISRDLSTHRSSGEGSLR